MASHPNHARFVTLLKGYKDSQRIRYTVDLAEHLGVHRTSMYEWLRYSLPSKRNLDRLAVRTGIKEFRTLR